MSKERFLTVLVPIKGNEDWIVDLEVRPTVYNTDENVIYRYGGMYVRRYGDNIIRGIVDREFPEIGQPLEIFDFQYDATRMGNAPVISASNVKWYKNLDDLWTQECHVSFGGENYYLKQIPTSSKNEDARYQYDISFISERYVLETVYFYDVVTAFYTDKPVSESTKFSFFGTVKELAKRLNTSLVRSGLSKYREYTEEGGTYLAPLTLHDWNESPVSGDRDRVDTYNHFHGDYTMYLHGDETHTKYIATDSNGDPIVDGYRVVVDYPDDELEEKFVAFDNDTIHSALQEVKDTWGLQYYIKREYNPDWGYTGTTLIVIGECEYDFGEDHPFQYGRNNELLSIEKSNTTESIVTRCTGTGSTENIPYHYPNPTPDGWIKPVYMVDGIEQFMVGSNADFVQYAKEGDNLYENFLKNRIGDVFQFGKKVLSINRYYTIERYSSYITSFDENGVTLCYGFTIEQQTRVKALPFECTWDGSVVSYHLFLNGTEITNASNAFIKDGGVGNLEEGTYNLVYIITFTNGAPTTTDNIQYYYYPQKSAWCEVLATWGIQHLITILYSAFSLSAIRSLIRTFIGFDSTIPAFLSTNPNLKFRDSTDAQKMGWYDGSRRIGKSEMIFGEYDTDYYVFLGGDGQKSIGVDDVYKSHFGHTIQTYNTQIAGLDETGYDALSTLEFFTKLNYGDSWGIITSDDIVDVNYNIDDFITKYINFSFDGYIADGWYKSNKKCVLSDFGITNEDLLNNSADVLDTIEFKRVKYLTPQQTLMPEIYYRTDGERRYYNAVNYYRDGEADAAAGEDYLYHQLTSEPTDWATSYNTYYRLVNGSYTPISDATAPSFSGGIFYERGRVKNDLYKKDDNSGYFDFENEYVQRLPREHIEQFEDIKPTIKGLVYNGHRIDVAAEYAYDEHDDDSVWLSGEDGTEGEYKHPHFFIKLRPLGFNLFDMALTEDMELSLTSGHCGSCTFKIKVDDRTKKNPVQVWEQDVYRLEDGEYVLEAHKGDLKRYRTYPLYNSIHAELTDKSYLINPVSLNAVTTSQIINGRAGSIRKSSSVKIEGDVITRGTFQHNTDADGIDQQDTTEKSVWLALEKDTDTFGVLMPSVISNYVNGDIASTIRPVSVADTGNEDTADTFVLLNIRMPQLYIRNAEHELSRAIVKYMYEHNPQKFNFSINFSRIYLAKNEDVENNLNENSVFYVKYNNKVYKQYVAQYSYKMSHDVPLPEITVTMNEELSAVRNADSRDRRVRLGMRREIDAAVNAGFNELSNEVSRSYVSLNGTSVVQGTIVSQSAGASISDLKFLHNKTFDIVSKNKLKSDENFAAISAYSNSVTDVLNQIKYTMESRIENESDGVCHRIKVADGVYESFWATSTGAFIDGTYINVSIPTLRLNN